MKSVEAKMAYNAPTPMRTRLFLASFLIKMLATRAREIAPVMAAVALAIFLNLYRLKATADVDQADVLQG